MPLSNHLRVKSNFSHPFENSPFVTKAFPPELAVIFERSDQIGASTSTSPCSFAGNGIKEIFTESCRILDPAGAGKYISEVWIRSGVTVRTSLCSRLKWSLRRLACRAGDDWLFLQS